MHTHAPTKFRVVVSHSFIGCALAAALAMPVRAQTAHRELDAAKPFAAMSASAQLMRDSLVVLAKAQIGTPYVTGGNSPDRGFDCSGLVKYVMSSLHINLPRTAKQQAGVGIAIQREAERLRPGDLLTFSRSKKSGVSHVGIYIGNGKYIHASSVAGQVVESSIERRGSSLIRAWRGARRVLQLGQLDSKPTAKKLD